MGRDTLSLDEQSDAAVHSERAAEIASLRARLGEMRETLATAERARDEWRDAIEDGAGLTIGSLRAERAALKVKLADAEARVRELECMQGEYAALSADLTPECRARVAAERRATQREAIEAAAEVADRAALEFKQVDERPYPLISFSTAGNAAKAIASRIRALGTKGEG